MRRWIGAIALTTAGFLVVGGLKYAEQFQRKQLRLKTIAACSLQTEPVIFAIKDVRKGELVTSDMIELRQVRCMDVPGGTLWTPDLAVGLTAHHAFKKGALLTTDCFNLDESNPQFVAKQGEGYLRMDRAMSKKVHSLLVSGHH